MRWRLDRQIGIMKYIGVADGFTDTDIEYSPAIATPTGIKRLPGSERLSDAVKAANAPSVFMIRWTPELDPDAPDGLNPKDRLEYPLNSGRFFDIASAIELGRHEWIEIAATARTDR